MNINDLKVGDKVKFTATGVISEADEKKVVVSDVKLGHDYAIIPQKEK